MLTIFAMIILLPRRAFTFASGWVKILAVNLLGQHGIGTNSGAIGPLLGQPVQVCHVDALAPVDTLPGCNLRATDLTLHVIRHIRIIHQHFDGRPIVGDNTIVNILIRDSSIRSINI
jgi:hypothetical protein